MMCGGGIHEISMVEVIESFAALMFTPISGSVWWFITAYCLLMVLSPFVNSFLQKLNQKGFLVTLLFIYLFWYTLGNIHSNVYDLEIAIFYYVLGAYFRKYPLRNRQITLFIISVFMIIACGYLHMFESRLMAIDEISSMALVERKLISMALIILRPIIVLCIFSIFQNAHIAVNKYINFLGQHTLGVYLFHFAPFTRVLIFVRIVDNTIMESNWFYVYLLIIPFIIFSVGIALDVVKDIIYEKLNPYLDKELRILSSRLTV